MSPEKETQDELITRVHSVPEKALKYQARYLDLEILFGKKKGDHIRSVMDIKPIRNRHIGVRGNRLDLVRRKETGSGFEIKLALPLAPANYREWYSRVLPAPKDLTIEVLEDISGDGILDQVLFQLSLESVQKGLKVIKDK